MRRLIIPCILYDIKVTYILHELRNQPIQQQPRLLCDHVTTWPRDHVLSAGSPELPRDWDFFIEILVFPRTCYIAKWLPLSWSWQVNKSFRRLLRFSTIFLLVLINIHEIYVSTQHTHSSIAVPSQRHTSYLIQISIFIIPKIVLILGSYCITYLPVRLRGNRVLNIDTSFTTVYVILILVLVVAVARPLPLLVTVCYTYYYSYSVEKYIK